MSAKASRVARSNFARTALAIALGLASGYASAAATIIINNINGPGVGFNDPTAVAPVGGNPGTTIGAQRLNAFQHAASIWGATLTSSIPIVIRAQFSALTCTATSATLGSAGATMIFANFPGAIQANTWYSQALANKLAGAQQNTTADISDINANFNINLGNANCLAGSPFYLGLDNNHGAAIDLVSVLLHEFGHGLGFQTFTSGTSGNFAGPPALPSAWDRFILDNTTNLNWTQMTAAQRVASAINDQHLVWQGPGVTAISPTILPGGPVLQLQAPASIAGSYTVGTAGFGTPITPAGITRQIMPLTGAAGSNQVLGCDPFTAVNAAAVNQKIALIDRGVCAFTQKVKNAQNAGAVAVIIANNAAGSAPGLGGGDPTITIPTLSVSQADGNTLKAAAATRSRNTSPLIGKIFLDPTVLAGRDTSNRVKLYAPNPFIGGSSVSHYDVSAYPNLIMEPNINGDLQHVVVPNGDITFTLLQDIGW